MDVLVVEWEEVPNLRDSSKIQTDDSCDQECLIR